MIDNGDTIPFIARYRKEVTGSLDDSIHRDLYDRLEYLRIIEKRKDEVKTLIEAQGKLTPEIEQAILNAKTITEVDDIYRPFRPKRKPRASIARERGLEELATLILEQRIKYEPSIEKEAERFVSEEKEVPDVASAISGACDIIAEDISDNAESRKALRSLTFEHGMLNVVKAIENLIKAINGNTFMSISIT